MNQCARLILGSAQFGMDYGIANKVGRVCDQEVGLMLDLCRLNQINLIDTAISYGLSEACLGSSGIIGFDVITKLPQLPVGCTDIVEWVRSEIIASINRLKVPVLYGVLFHYPQDLYGPYAAQLYSAVNSLKKDGLVKKIGVSVYDPSEIQILLKKYNFDIVQAPLNIIDRRLANSGLLNQLKDLDVEVHARSIFLQGLLLMPFREMPVQFIRWQSLWEAWHYWLERVKLNPLMACLAYSYSVKGVDRIILGVDSASQLIQAIQFVGELPDLDDLPSISSECLDLINPSRWSSV